jgi:hypothetical protein
VFGKALADVLSDPARQPFIVKVDSLRRAGRGGMVNKRKGAIEDRIYAAAHAR